MNGLAIPTDSQAVARRVVTACCGGHRPASDCVCCPECVTNAVGGRLDPAIRALVAADEREIASWVRPGYRRVVGALEREALWDDLRTLGRVTHAAIAAWCLTSEPVGEHDTTPAQASRWFSRSGVLT